MRSLRSPIDIHADSLMRSLRSPMDVHSDSLMRSLRSPTDVHAHSLMRSLRSPTDVNAESLMRSLNSAPNAHSGKSLLTPNGLKSSLKTFQDMFDYRQNRILTPQDAVQMIQHGMKFIKPNFYEILTLRYL